MLYPLQAEVTDPLFGRVEILPLHTILLDLAHCGRHDFVTVPPPPPPTPLPPPGEDATPTCLGFYDAIRSFFRRPFTCKHLGGACEAGVNCTLHILDTRYHVTVSYVDAVRNFVFEVLSVEGRSLGMGDEAEVSVTLPTPPGAVLSLSQRLVASGVRGFQVSEHR